MLFRERRIENRPRKYAERRSGIDRRVQATAVPTERRCRILPTAQAVADRRQTITTTQSLSLTPFVLIRCKRAGPGHRPLVEWGQT